MRGVTIDFAHTEKHSNAYLCHKKDLSEDEPSPLRARPYDARTEEYSNAYLCFTIYSFSHFPEDELTILASRAVLLLIVRSESLKWISMLHKSTSLKTQDVMVTCSDSFIGNEPISEQRNIFLLTRLKTKFVVNKMLTANRLRLPKHTDSK